MGAVRPGGPAEPHGPEILTNFYPGKEPGIIPKEMSVMKRYFFALTGLALLAGTPLLAQGPVAQRPVPIVIQRESSAGPLAAEEIQVGPGGAHGKIICVPDHYLKKTTHWCYCHVDLRVCQCYFHGLFGKCGCDQGRCEHPYCRRVMIKKPRVEECDRTRCVPQEVPACGCVPGHQ